MKKLCFMFVAALITGCAEGGSITPASDEDLASDELFTNEELFLD